MIKLRKKQWWLLGILLVGIFLGGMVFIADGMLAQRVEALESKAYLAQDDFEQALLSEGIWLRSVKGDQTPLSYMNTIPMVYKGKGMHLLVYAYDDVFLRRFGAPTFSDEMYQQTLGLSVQAQIQSAAKNIVIVYLLDDRDDDKGYLQIKTAVDKTLNHEQKDVIIKEQDGVRFTLAETYYNNPILDKSNDVMLYDGKTSYELSCEYIAPTVLEEQEAEVTVTVLNSTRGAGGNWDGVGVFEALPGGGAGLSEDPQAMVYAISFRHGDQVIDLTLDSNGQR